MGYRAEYHFPRDAGRNRGALRAVPGDLLFLAGGTESTPAEFLGTLPTSFRSPLSLSAGSR
jgi:hypothetical protein